MGSELELFLILDAYGDRAQLLTYVLEPLASDAKPSSVRAHYRSDIDVALLGLRFAPSVELSRVRLLAKRSGIKVIDPAELDDAGRASFYDNQLAAYPIVVEHCELASALAELSRRVTGGDVTRVERPMSPGEYHSVRGRGGELNPLARGTRDFVRPLPVARGTHSLGSEPVKEPVHVDTRPPRFAGQIPASKDRIAVHISRGDEWTIGRLRFLSAQRAAVAATVTPHIGDPISLSLSFADQELTVSGVVDSVDRPLDLATPVSTGFSVDLEGMPAKESRALVALLHRAAAAGVKLTPPPLRPARFQVSWPLIVAPLAGGDPMRVTALDASLDGMFLHKVGLPRELTFALPVDERGAPAIRGRLEVVREMSAAQANNFGFTPGCGVAVRELARGDRVRWDAFISRVRERNDRRLMVAAAPERLASLVVGLRAVGYVVTSSSDPAAVVESISGKLRPDVAIIDASLTRLESETELMLSLIREHHLFTLATGGEHVEDTRRAVDELLGI